jgi:hypothetical protein
MSLFECKDIGLMEEYVGSIVEINSRKMKFKQPVLLQSFIDEFEVDANSKVNLPTMPGQVLAKGKDHEIMDGIMRTKYRSGVGKLWYLATWSRPDILNAVREVLQHMQAPTKMHYEAMIRVMPFCTTTPERGRVIAPHCKWDRAREFKVSSKSDSTYNECPETRKSVSGNKTELNGMLIIVRSIMQETMKLSVMEAELDSTTTNVQDMLCLTDCGKPGAESENSNEFAGGPPGCARTDQQLECGRKDKTCCHQSNVSAQIERVGFIGD